MDMKTDHCCVAIIHALGFLLVIGYAQNYYFHLRTLNLSSMHQSRRNPRTNEYEGEQLYDTMLMIDRPPQEQCSLSDSRLVVVQLLAV